MKYNTVDIGYLRKHFMVDSDGRILRKTRQLHHLAGSEAGWASKLYRRISIKGVKIRSHRIAWALYYGKWPDGVIDHIDGNGFNNRKENLRSTTQKHNSRNQKRRITNSSGQNGVAWCKALSKWRAAIMSGGTQIHLGYFDTLIAATYCRHVANLKYGFHLNHGGAR